MNNYKLIGLSSLSVLLMACDGGGSDPGAALPTPPSDVATLPTPLPDVGGAGETYSSNYCVHPDITNASDDVFVSIDAFSIAPDIPDSIQNADVFEELRQTILYTSLSMSTVSANFTVAFGPMFATGFCAAEFTPDSQCDLIIPGTGDGGLRAVGSVALGILEFDLFMKPTGSSIYDLKVSTYSGKVSPYWEGSYTLYVDPDDPASVESVINWRRDLFVEVYSSTSTNGDFFNATENSDCSGTLSSSTTDEFGTVTTIDGSWAISGATTTGEVTKCFDGDCDSTSW